MCNVPVLVGQGCAGKIPQPRVLVREEDDSPFCRKNRRAGVRLVAAETPECGQEVSGLRPLQRRPSSGAFTAMQAAQVINRSWRPLCGWKAVIRSPSGKRGAMAHSWSAVVGGCQRIQREARQERRWWSPLCSERMQMYGNE